MPGEKEDIATALETTPKEVVLPTFSECDQGRKAIEGWVMYYDQDAGRRIAWAVLFAAKNPSLSLEEVFQVMHGEDGKLVEPPFAPETDQAETDSLSS